MLCSYHSKTLRSRVLQNAGMDIKAKFTAGITCERNINGLKVKETFASESDYLILLSKDLE
jgi:hypothetical protein